MENRELMYLAENAKQKSYSPYSKFKVGAALLTKDGKIYVGANIENSSYPLTVCAERVAFFKAISEGEKEFEKIAISGSSDNFCFPCGACRQVMSEFCAGDFKILCAGEEEVKTFTLSELLPERFGPEVLK